jgi:hypothetical protein
MNKYLIAGLILVFFVLIDIMAYAVDFKTNSKRLDNLVIYPSYDDVVPTDYVYHVNTDRRGSGNDHLP